VMWGVWGDRPRRVSRLVLVGVTALLGTGVLYGPVLLARGRVPSPWGDVSTAAGWWALVSARMYRRFPFGLDLAVWPQRLLSWIGIVGRQFTPAGAILAGGGWVWLWRRCRPLAVSSLAAWASLSVYAIGYDTADSLAYLVPALVLMAVWLGVGLRQAADWLHRRVRGAVFVLLLLPLAQGVLYWGSMDVSEDRTAVVFMERVLETAPPQAVLLTAQDGHTFTLWYGHDVLDRRPDVVVIDRDLWGQHRPYRTMMAAELGVDLDHQVLSAEEVARQAGRPVEFVE